MRVIKRSEFDSLLRKIKKISAGGGGQGGGDMLKSVYDINNDGIVDNSDKLDGEHSSAFAPSSHNHDSVYAPISKGVTNGDSHDHVGGDGAAITENALSLSDITTGNANASRHGFCPKVPNDTSKFLRGDGEWAVPSGAGGLGYTLQAAATSFSPSGGITYYIGQPGTAQSTADRNRVYFPKAGTIKRAIVYWCATGTAGTAEVISVYLSKNNLSDTLIGQWENSEAKKVMNNGELNISVSAGDYFEIKIVCPTWATNPTNVLISVVVYVE